MSKRKRRQFSAEDKAAILRRHLAGKGTVKLRNRAGTKASITASKSQVLGSCST